MSAIPVSLLRQMGTYHNINIHGTTLTVNTADSENAIISLMSDFRSHIERNYIKVVGVDLKLKSDTSLIHSKKYMIALCASNRCLIFHVDFQSTKFCESPVDIFLKDPDICFVGPTRLFREYNCWCGSEWKSLLVEVGELAAMALKRPGLTTSPLADIACKAGVRYDGPASGTGKVVTVDLRNPIVLTVEMMKTTINDAVAHYLIGCKLSSN